jgi:hypothetical protein
MMNMGKGTRIIESFSNWLSGYDINENIAAAKVYMQKRYANRLKKDVRELTPEEKDKALTEEQFEEQFEIIEQI